MVTLFRSFVLLASLFIVCACGTTSEEEAKYSEDVGSTRSEEAKAIEKLDRIAEASQNGDTPELVKVEAQNIDPPEEKEQPKIEKAKAHWGYKGDSGPSFWAGIDPSFIKCSQGKAQSPINLVWSKPSKGQSLEFSYKSGELEVVDNGHTIQINVPSGNKLSVNGETYELQQFHFHSTSEHTLSGKSFPLEMHLVHKSESGKAAVVAVLFDKGLRNEVLASIWKNIPTKKNEPVKVQGLLLDPVGLLPKQKTFYQYQGSLTTPPCTEGVLWNVLNTPVQISDQQLSAFRSLYPKNNRPLQERNSRKIENF